MNRQIKYRVWDKASQTFLFSEISGKHPFHFIGGLEVYTIEPSHPDYVLNQFTGLVDKKGKKIFEGDILNCPWEFARGRLFSIGYVVFWEGAFGLAKREELNEFLEQHYCPWEMYGFNDTPTRTYFWKDATIIGNIYENPELLQEIHKEYLDQETSCDTIGHEEIPDIRDYLPTDL